MSFSIEYVYHAIDKFSPTARKIKNVVGGITRQLSPMVRKLREAASKVKHLKDRLKALGGRLKTTLSSMKSVGTGMTLGLTVPLGVFAGLALTASANIETLRVSFESLLKSEDAAKVAVKSLIDFTAKTPFQLAGVGKAAKQLLAFGVENENLITVMTTLGDIAAGAGIPLTDMASIFGKVKSKGKLMTEELLQLSERGIPIIDLLAKRFNVTKGVIFEAASKSQISFKMMEDAFASLTGTGGIFHDQMNKQSKTLAGIFSTLKDNVNLSLATIGDTLEKTLNIKETMKSLITGIQDATKAFKEFADNNPKLTKFLVIMTGVLSILGPLAIGVAVLGFLLGAIFSPIVLIVAGLSALIALGLTFADNWDDIRMAIGGTIDVIVVKVQTLVKDIKTAFTDLKEWIGTLNPFEGIVDNVKKVAGIVKNFDIKGSVGGFFNKINPFSGNDTSSLNNITARPEGLNAPKSLLINNNSQNAVDVNIKVSDPSGIVQGVATKTLGSSSLNTGKNFK